MSSEEFILWLNTAKHRPVSKLLKLCIEPGHIVNQEIKLPMMLPLTARERYVSWCYLAELRVVTAQQIENKLFHMLATIPFDGTFKVEHGRYLFDLKDTTAEFLASLLKHLPHYKDNINYSWINPLQELLLERKFMAPKLKIKLKETKWASHDIHSLDHLYGKPMGRPASRSVYHKRSPSPIDPNLNTAITLEKIDAVSSRVLTKANQLIKIPTKDPAMAHDLMVIALEGTIANKDSKQSFLGRNYTNLRFHPSIANPTLLLPLLNEAWMLLNEMDEPKQPI